MSFQSRSLREGERWSMSTERRVREHNLSRKLGGESSETAKIKVDTQIISLEQLETNKAKIYTSPFPRLSVAACIKAREY